MKTGMLRNLAVAGLAAFVMAQPAAAISIGVVGTPATVATGDNFSVDIVISGITNEIITAWDIDVAFDSRCCTTTSRRLMSSHYGSADTIYDANFGAGLTDAFLVSLLSDAQIRALQCPGGACAGSLKILTLSFTALADGVPLIDLVNWGLANDIKCENNRQCYPVPEPGSLALLGLGLAGLGFTRRRKA